ncbi:MULTISPECIES: extracellular solute-binding protein [Salinibaculum]|uniref:extracellular solute-binding protein n=1 Tax=Salinibaculum TaxID=2732368 RepID=UPI0030D59075
MQNPSSSGTGSSEQTSRAEGVDSTSRRAFLTSSAAATVAAFAGCSGDGSDGGDGGSGGDGGDGGDGSSGTSGGDSEPSTPWETQDLANYIDGDETLTIYAGTGDAQEWRDLIKVVNAEFGTSIKGNVFAGTGGDVSQRFLQEYQADNHKCDILTVASDVWDQIKLKAKEEDKQAAHELAKQYYEWDMDKNFWFTDVLSEDRLLPFLAAGFNGGAGLSLPVNEDIFEEQGLDYPTDYNDLFDDQYEGLTMAVPGYVVSGEVGWVIKHHAAETDMSEMEWISALKDHLEFVGTSSYTSGIRAVGQGDYAMQIHNWPWVVQPFIGDNPIRGIFPPGVKMDVLSGGLGVNANAPNPWVARFFISAMLEEPVQRAIVTDVKDQSPVRTDLDYSSDNPDRFMKKRLNADVTPIGFYEGAKFSDVGQTAKDNGAFDI